MNKNEEMALLAAFNKMKDEDRLFLIRVAEARAKANPAIPVFLKLIVGGRGSS